MIGPRLRELRVTRGLSLRRLAAETGLSATLLSQIERGVTNPSLKSLRLLAGYFGQSISTLFQEEPEVLGGTSSVTTPGHRALIQVPSGRARYERLTQGNGQLEVLLGTLHPGEASSEERWSHEAVECAYVLRGELTVELGEETLVLEAGHAITLRSTIPHRYLNTGDVVTEFHVSVTPPTP
ncbi:cupin domain-containing protein [Ornithinimicrobium sp. LYQ92]|uniref:cupin domain-containing protein n=1 Tax=Serinicoccus sp. LYQ92 TaxID=3378798 RepID=UPI003853E21D